MAFMDDRKRNNPNKQRAIVPAAAKTGEKYPGIPGSISPEGRIKEKYR